MNPSLIDTFNSIVDRQAVLLALSQIVSLASFNSIVDRLLSLMSILFISFVLLSILQQIDGGLVGLGGGLGLDFQFYSRSTTPHTTAATTTFLSILQQIDVHSDHLFLYSLLEFLSILQQIDGAGVMKGVFHINVDFQFYSRSTFTTPFLGELGQPISFNSIVDRL